MMSILISTIQRKGLTWDVPVNSTFVIHPDDCKVISFEVNYESQTMVILMDKPCVLRHAETVQDSFIIVSDPDVHGNDLFGPVSHRDLR